MENTGTRVIESDAAKSTGQLQREMEQTRESITEKVAALETQMLDTFQTAANTVTTTVDAVKEVVTATPTAVKESVKQTVDAVKETLHDTVGYFSVSGCVRDYPWSAFGASLLGGFLVGYRLSRPGKGTREYLAARAPAMEPVLPAPAKPREPRLIDALMVMLGKGVRKLAEDTLTTALQSVNRSIGERVPGAVDLALHHLSEQLSSGTRVAHRTATFSPDGEPWV